MMFLLPPLSNKRISCFTSTIVTFVYLVGEFENRGGFVVFHDADCSEFRHGSIRLNLLINSNNF